MPFISTPRFVKAMLACHLASTFALLLYFHGAITETWQIAFETLLLVFKTCAELLLIDFTLDLAAHHIAMFFASWVVNTYFPAHAYLVVYCQSIHLALALHYSRKVSGLKSGRCATRSDGGPWRRPPARQARRLVAHTHSDPGLFPSGAARPTASSCTCGARSSARATR
eukprot:1980530-Prymnesium_polylepis.1